MAFENILESYLVSLGFKIQGSEFTAATKVIDAFGKNASAVAGSAAGSIGKIAEGLGGKLAKAIDLANTRLEKAQRVQTSKASRSVSPSAARIGQRAQAAARTISPLASMVGPVPKQAVAGPTLSPLAALVGPITQQQRAAAAPQPTVASSIGPRAKAIQSLQSAALPTRALFGGLSAGAGLLGGIGQAANQTSAQLAGVINRLKSIGSLAMQSAGVTPKNLLTGVSVLTKMVGGFAAAVKGVFNWSERIIKVQGLIVGGFAAIVGTIVALADHVANADLQYQLLGMRMMMTADQAKRLKISTDAVGASIEDIAFNPELRARFEEVQDLQTQMAKGLGPNFEQNMRSFRDVMFDLTKLKVALFSDNGLLPGIINKILGRFGTSIEGVQEKLEGFLNSIAKNAPQITDWFADKLTPILQDAQMVFTNLWGVAKDGGQVFTDLTDGVVSLVNAFSSGDSQISQGGSTLDKITGIIAKGSHMMRDFADATVEAEQVVLHMVAALVDVLQFKFGAALDEFGKGIAGIHQGSGRIIGSVLGAGGGGAVLGSIGAIGGGALGTMLLGPGIGTAIGAATGGTLLGGVGTAAGGATLGWLGGLFGNHNPWAGTQSAYEQKAKQSGALDIQDKLKAAAMQYNLPPALLLSLAQQESGFKQIDESTGQTLKSRTGALGVMQLLPSTAKDLGVNPFDIDQNIAGGAQYLRKMLDLTRGDMWQAIAAYNEGPGAMSKGMMTTEALNEANAVMGRMNTNAYAQLTPQNVQNVTNANQNDHSVSQQITVNNNVTTKTDANPRDIANAVDDRMRQSFRNEAQLNIMRLQPSY